MTSAAKILLVEDEPTIRLVADKQFKALGYRISDFAEDGLSAVRKAVSTDYDVIFMDVRLPGQDGLEATRQIRLAGKNTVIVGMTAFSNRQQCIDAGMNDFLQKPILLNQLRRTLEKWLQRKSSQLNDFEKNQVAEKTEAFLEMEARLDGLRDRIQRLRRETGLD